MEHRSGCWGGTAHAQDIISLKLVSDGDIRLRGTADSSPHRNGTGNQYLVWVHRNVSQSTQANRPQVKLDQTNPGSVMSRTSTQSGYKRGVACQDLRASEARLKCATPARPPFEDSGHLP